MSMFRKFSSVSSSSSASTSATPISTNKRTVSNADETAGPVVEDQNTNANPPITPRTDHLFVVTSKDNVPVHPYPSLSEPKAESLGSGDVVLTISAVNASHVQEVRELKLNNGKVIVTNVADSLDSNSVRFTSISEPQAKILSQTFKKKEDQESKLRGVLHAHVGQKLIVQKSGNNNNNNEVSEGILQLVTNDHIILGSEKSKKEGEESDEVAAKVQLLALTAANVYVIPQPLPTLLSSILEWTIDSKAPSTIADFSYSCTGLKWDINYNVTANHNFTQLQLVGWYTLDNSTTAEFSNAKVIVEQQTSEEVKYRPRNPKEEGNYFSSSSSSNNSNIKKSFGSSFSSMKKKSVVRPEKKGTRRYHLPRKVTLPPHATVQESAVNVTVPSKRFHVVRPRIRKFEGKVDIEDHSVQEYREIDQVVTFLNSSENQLGFALPSGKCGTFVMQDEDLSTVTLTPFTFRLEDEVAVLPISRLSDTNVTIQKTNFHLDNKRRVMRETFDISIANNTQGDITDLIIEENVPRWSEWEATGSATITPHGVTPPIKNPFIDLTCEKHERKANRIVFSVPVVPFASTVIITYTVTYANWAVFV